MRVILPVVLLLLAVWPAGAQTSEEKAYVDARQRIVAELEAKRRSLPQPVNESAWNREETRAQEALKAQFQKVLGPAPPPKGFSGFGMHPDPVCCGPGAGALDGFAISNGRIRAVMTTEGILGLWSGRDPRAALANDELDYYRALNADAPVEIFAPLAVVPPAGADLAIGRLVIKGRDVGRLPLHIVVAVVKQGRVNLALFPASLETPSPDAPCEVLWKDASERYRSAEEIDTRRAINAEAGAAFERCLRGRENGRLLPGLSRRAQRSVDALAAE